MTEQKFLKMTVRIVYHKKEGRLVGYHRLQTSQGQRRIGRYEVEAVGPGGLEMIVRCLETISQTTFKLESDSDPDVIVYTRSDVPKGF